MPQTPQMLTFVALSFFATMSSAQDAPTKPQCEPPRPGPSRPSTQALRPEVNVLCGSNSITQTLSPQPQPSESHSKPTSASAESPLLAALIAGAAGVLGAFAGALVSFLVAREKSRSDLSIESQRLKANVVATERLRWLQDIRQRLSRFYQQLDLQYNHLQRPTPPNQHANKQQLLDEFSAEVMTQCNMITLMLNPGKPDQAALRVAVDKGLQLVLENFNPPLPKSPGFNAPEYAENKRAAFDSMTKIGIETWKQIKSLS